MASTLPSRLAGAAMTLLAVACGGAGDGAVQASPPSIGMPATPALSPVAPGTLRMHLRRHAGDTAHWNVYSWDGPRNFRDGWITGRFPMHGRDAFGGIAEIPVDPRRHGISFLLAGPNGARHCPANQYLEFGRDIGRRGQEIWLLDGDCTLHAAEPVPGR